MSDAIISDVEWTTLITAANTDGELHRLATTDDFLFSLLIADKQWCQKSWTKAYIYINNNMNKMNNS